VTSASSPFLQSNPCVITGKSLIQLRGMRLWGILPLLNIFAVVVLPPKPILDLRCIGPEKATLLGCQGPKQFLEFLREFQSKNQGSNLQYRMPPEKFLKKFVSLPQALQNVRMMRNGSVHLRLPIPPKPRPKLQSIPRPSWLEKLLGLVKLVISPTKKWRPDSSDLGSLHCLERFEKIFQCLFFNN